MIMFDSCGTVHYVKMLNYFGHVFLLMKYVFPYCYKRKCFLRKRG